MWGLLYGPCSCSAELLFRAALWPYPVFCEHMTCFAALDATLWDYSPNSATCTTMGRSLLSFKSPKLLLEVVIATHGIIITVEIFFALVKFIRLKSDKI